jgi:hypothetical protein
MNEAIEQRADEVVLLSPDQQREVASPQNRQLTTPAQLIELALSRGADVATLEQLMRLQIQWDQHQLVLAKVDAEKAFNEAMAAFKANPPTIAKDKHVHYIGQKGEVDYDHATHFGVTKAIAEALSLHGLSHSWKTEQAGDKITVTCTIKHVQGHSESTSLTATNDGSGGKNSIQAIGSAKTYLERYTLLGITGLSTADMPDDDGNAAGMVGPVVVESVLQGLTEELAKAADDKACVALWNSGKKTLAALGDRSAYDEFKAAVFARRTALKAPTPEASK